ncbi:hypothetical protein DAT35_55135 [Vitiosangium sp. GDMCC 1.1324]|nr:hypothetical protein DAT35_55135 [Vitiosangium sp. GDMCC 1.1324]
MKFEFIEAEKAHFPVDFMCQQLGVSRSGYYAWKERPESERHKEDRALAEVVTEEHKESRGTYGSPRVHAELRARGQRVSRKRVARLMRQQELAARAWPRVMEWVWFRGWLSHTRRGAPSVRPSSPASWEFPVAMATPLIGNRIGGIPNGADNSRCSHARRSQR